MPGSFSRAYDLAHDVGCGWYPSCALCDDGIRNCLTCMEFGLPNGCDYNVISGDWRAEGLGGDQPDEWMISNQGGSVVDFPLEGLPYNHSVSALFVWDSPSQVPVEFRVYMPADGDTYVHVIRGEFIKLYIDGVLADTGQIFTPWSSVSLRFCISYEVISVAIIDTVLSEVLAGDNPTNIIGDSFRVVNGTTTFDDFWFSNFVVRVGASSKHPDCTPCADGTDDCASCADQTSANHALITIPPNSFTMYSGEFINCTDDYCSSSMEGIWAVPWIGFVGSHPEDCRFYVELGLCGRSERNERAFLFVEMTQGPGVLWIGAYLLFVDSPGNFSRPQGMWFGQVDNVDFPVDCTALGEIELVSDYDDWISIGVSPIVGCWAREGSITIEFERAE